MKPLDETISSLVSALPEELRELWEERAAIREHEGGLPRDLAEALALLDIVKSCPSEVVEFWK